MSESQRDQLIALAGTALIVILLVLALVLAHYRVDITAQEDRKWPPVDSSEIVFGGEYVKLGDMPFPVEETDNSPMPDDSRTDAAVDGTDLADAGDAVAEAPSLVTSQNESTMKVIEKPAPEKAGPTKEEIAERERIKRQKEEAEKQAKIKDRMKSGFSNSKKGKGEAGSPNGNSNTGALSGLAGHDLRGRTAEAWGKPASTLSGTVKIKVRVNRKGQVIGTPEYVGGTGPAAANAGVRRSCIAASRQSRFSVDLEAPAEQTGVITWKFE